MHEVANVLTRFQMVPFGGDKEEEAKMFMSEIGCSSSSIGGDGGSITFEMFEVC
jgi:hypothetical protein